MTFVFPVPWSIKRANRLLLNERRRASICCGKGGNVCGYVAIVWSISMQCVVHWVIGEICKIFASAVVRAKNIGRKLIFNVLLIKVLDAKRRMKNYYNRDEMRFKPLCFWWGKWKRDDLIQGFRRKVINARFFREANIIVINDLSANEEKCDS